MSKVKSPNFFASNAQIFDGEVGLQGLGLPSIPGLIVAQELLPQLQVCCRFLPIAPRDSNIYWKPWSN